LSAKLSVYKGKNCLLNVVGCKFNIFPGLVSLSLVPELDRPDVDVWCFEKKKRVMMDWWALEIQGDLKTDVADRQINYTNLL
jgi:hypothetical protein